MRLSALLKVLRYRSWTGASWQAILSVLANHRTLLLLATGCGKSLCYQLPAYLLLGCLLGWAVDSAVAFYVTIAKAAGGGFHACGLPAGLPYVRPTRTPPGLLALWLE